MTFGELSKIINTVKKKLLSELKDNTEQLFSKKEIIYIANNIYPSIKKKHKELNFELLCDILDRFFTKQYSFSKNINFKNGQKCFRDWDIKFKIDEVNTTIINIPEKYKQLEAHFQKLFNTPQPEQRTKEWFDYRYKRITASDTATSIDLNPYEPVENFYVKKCDPNYPFLDNKFVFHGKKYEQIATMMYEHIYNNKVTEFGCLPSESYKILGASPDGICSKSTLDGKFSDRLGVMLEIKCPFSRKIITKGKIKGGICPFYYYCQVQQQLECCNLEYCDFWQCNIYQYLNRNKFLTDKKFITCKLTEGIDAKTKKCNNLITRGCLIQLLPFDYIPTHSEDKKEFKSTYLYPPRLDMTLDEYDNWIINTISTWQQKYPELAKKYYFDQVLYWKIPNAHNVTIKRDKIFFNKIYPIILDTWNKVKYYRLHPEQLEFLHPFINKSKNFYRMPTTFEINNNLTDKKILFLEDVSFSDSEENNECDFID